METRPTTAFRKVSNSISSEEALVPISDEKEDKLAAARHWNYLGKIVYLVLYLMFNLVFWIIALTEYVRPAEEYINGNLIKLYKSTITINAKCLNSFSQLFLVCIRLNYLSAEFYSDFGK